MELRAETDAVTLIATALPVLDAPTALQVMWLVVLVGVLVVVATERTDHHRPDGGEGGGGGGLRRPRPTPMPPTGVM